MLLSIDWDAFSGTREFVFDAPIWGTADREADRLEAWQVRVQKRGGPDWDALAEDFPLYDGWQGLRQYQGVPAYCALSHAEAWDWLGRFDVQDVLNVDAHHDLCSFSGDPTRLRPGNWAGLALAAGRIQQYTCLYPAWHSTLAVAEGYDLTRTCAEIAPLLAPQVLERVTLARPDHLDWPAPAQVTSLLLVQSPAWTNPAHDQTFGELCDHLRATPISAPLMRN